MLHGPLIVLLHFVAPVTSYEAYHYAVFSSLPSRPPSYLQVFFSDTLNLRSQSLLSYYVYERERERENKFRTHTKQSINYILIFNILEMRQEDKT